MGPHVEQSCNCSLALFTAEGTEMSRSSPRPRNGWMMQDRDLGAFGSQRELMSIVGGMGGGALRPGVVQVSEEDQKPVSWE